jgi:S1-C subfamily serine protease
MAPSIVVEHLEGSSQSGSTQVFNSSPVRIGRHPANDVTFDAERDRLVSGRHAEVFVAGGALRIRDLGSRNGVFVNGKQIGSPWTLGPDDIVGLGRGGPSFKVRLDAEGARPVSAPKQGIGETTLFRVVKGAVQKERRRSALLVGVVFLVAIAGVVYLAIRQKEAEKKTPRQEDLLAELTRLNDEANEARSAEERARLEKRLQELQKSVRSEFTETAKKMQDAKSEEERKRLEERLAKLQDQVIKASKTDWPAIVSKYEKSIFLCVAKWPDGRAGIGTAWCIREDGLLATNAHVSKMLAGAPSREAVQNLTGKVFAVERMADHPEYDDTPFSPDISILRVRTGGEKLNPLPLADDARLRKIRVGTQLATIGFPGELLRNYLRQYGSGRTTTVQGTFKVGMVSAISNFRRETADYANSVFLQHSASLSGGTSGSPMFTADGQVVGIHNSGISVLFGSGGQRTPSAAAICFAIRADLIRKHLAATRW